MKKCIAAIIMVLFLVTASYAEHKPKAQRQKSSVKKESVKKSGQGCCSHHGGVCGCSNGRSLCCDKTLSATCKCN